MALSPRIEIRQSQSLTLTPQLMQSIRLLQLSHLDLEAFVDAELLRNPLLERDEGGPDDSAGAGEADVAAEAADFVDTVTEVERIRSADGIAESLDTEVENVFPEHAGSDSGEAPAAPWTEGGGAAADFEQFIAARPTLAEHLAEQVNLIIADPGERLIARYLIDGLNEAGYLTADLAAIAEQLGAPLALVEDVLIRIQGCEPAGVFARSVAECLALQLREKDRLDPMMARLLGHLDLVAGHDSAALVRAVGCDREDLADMLAELRALDPKPGRAFERGPVEAVVPDVFVREGPAGWIVELNAETLPRVLINNRYYARISRATRNKSERDYLTDRLQAANWLVKSLHQRATTILKVAAEIVEQQDGFFRHGVQSLRPLILRDIADAIGMHESTVSRVTSNKYIATPRGLFELKYFFTSAIAASRGGEAHSAEAVRFRIRHLIDREAAESTLSDERIVELLQAEGVDIARRTVAKYREAMRIPSSVQRRREKLMAL